MVVIRKDWQTLPASATTVNVPNFENHAQPTPEPTSTPLPDNTQQPIAHLVDLNEIKHDEPIEPWAVNITHPLLWSSLRKGCESFSSKASLTSSLSACHH